MTRILIVDDHELVRQGLELMLETEKSIEVVGSFGDPIKVLSEHTTLEPDVILMDIKMPEINGFDLSASLKSQCPGYKIILLSMEVNHAYIKRAISEKIDGYLPKNSNIDILLEAIVAVQNGDRYFDGQIKDYIFHMMIENKSVDEDDHELKRLSERELHVLRMIADGHQNKDISELLFISTKTVETHRNNILKKLNITSTADLVKFAIAKGVTNNPYITE